MTLLVAVLTLVVALLAVLVAGLLRSHAVILRRLHDLGAGIEDDPAQQPPAAAFRPPPATTSSAARPSRAQRPGRRAADVVGHTPEGGPVAVRTVDVAHDTLLLFLSSGCATCHEVWAGLVDGRVGVGSDVRVVVVTRGPGTESAAAVADLAPAGVTIVMSDAAYDDHGVAGTPYAVHVNGPSGRVAGEGTGVDWPQIARLLAEATGEMAYVGGARGRRRKAAADASREARVDAELLSAGVLPGDPSLYPGSDAPGAPR